MCSYKKISFASLLLFFFYGKLQFEYINNNEDVSYLVNLTPIHVTYTSAHWSVWHYLYGSNPKSKFLYNLSSSHLLTLFIKLELYLNCASFDKSIAKLAMIQLSSNSIYNISLKAPPELVCMENTALGACLKVNMQHSVSLHTVLISQYAPSCCIFVHSCSSALSNNADCMYFTCNVLVIHTYLHVSKHLTYIHRENKSLVEAFSILK